MEPQGARILADAREIAFPRCAGSEGDRRAREILKRRFERTGLDVREEPFDYDIRPALRVIRTVLVSCAALVAAASVIASYSPLAALLILGAGVLAGGLLLVWAPGAEKLYARPGPTCTANLSARRAADSPRLSLVLLAHYDSKSQNLSFPWRMGLTLLAILGGLGLLLLLVTGVATGAIPGLAWSSGAAGAVSALSLLGLSMLRSGNESPGGVDNAGSVAIVSELARILPGELPADVELIFLATGAEEDHMVGAMRWLDRHRETLRGRPVYALNFDGAGAPGKLVLIERYGAGRCFSPRLARAAREAASRLGLAVRSIWMPPAMGIDAIPFHHRGVDCLTFSSGSLGVATIAVHSARDVADHLDEETLLEVTRLARAVAAAIARRTESVGGA